MENNIFQEMHKLSHDDDRRYQLLMRGVRKLQEKKRAQGLLKRIYYSRARAKVNVKIGNWKTSEQLFDP